MFQLNHFSHNWQKSQVVLSVSLHNGVRYISSINTRLLLITAKVLKSPSLEQCASG